MKDILEQLSKIPNKNCKGFGNCTNRGCERFWKKTSQTNIFKIIENP